VPETYFELNPVMRYIKWIIISLALILIITYYTGGYIARELVKYGLEYVKPELEDHGITIKQLHYGNVTLYSFKSFSIKGVDLKFDLEKEIYGRKSFSAVFHANSLIVRLANLRDPTIKLTLRDFNLHIQSNEENPDRPFGKFENAYWKGEAPIKLYGLQESGKLVVNRLKTLFRENSIPDPMEFEGDAILSLDGYPVKIGMSTKRVDNRTYLVLNKDDVLTAVGDLPDVEISDEEAVLISRYPARALHILKITREAQHISKRKKSEKENFPDDAFKHIYWSYHLSRTFGSEFAKEITDAHETLPNNTTRERQMDFHNNEVGRNLASRNLSVGELERIVLTSPDVIRSPDQMD
jgi:hypothetical protein